MSPKPGRGAPPAQRPALRGRLKGGIAQKARRLLQGRGTAQLLVRGQQFLKPRIAHHGALRRSDHHLLGHGRRVPGQVAARPRVTAGRRHSTQWRTPRRARQSPPPASSGNRRRWRLGCGEAGQALNGWRAGTKRRAHRRFLREALVQAAPKMRSRRHHLARAQGPATHRRSGDRCPSRPLPNHRAGWRGARPQSLPRPVGHRPGRT
jgi:hypothetical protein